MYNIYIIPTRNNINIHSGPPSYALPRPYLKRTQSSFSFLHISSKPPLQTSIRRVCSHFHSSWPVKGAVGTTLATCPASCTCLIAVLEGNAHWKGRMVSRPTWVALRCPASCPGGHKPNRLLPLQGFYDIFAFFYIF